ncbi:hypothetical protein CYLTODRAFT_485727 [Cylindrobasidium torrendii FP15055 ss-10]|uniref:Uncharacterized protein n=1 Tax=Cylindrobasidium torrendii FP15055 ss-10 TaxID=1314674 RepID=A0A0D7BUL0_9AGAR|nr:hypothetical protein CYLTODRAFT_485727 [Cylindrobasidium torrendii FP15055 ss-10]
MAAPFKSEKSLLPTHSTSSASSPRIVRAVFVLLVALQLAMGALGLFTFLWTLAQAPDTIGRLWADILADEPVLVGQDSLSVQPTVLDAGDRWQLVFGSIDGHDAVCPGLVECFVPKEDILDHVPNVYEDPYAKGVFLGGGDLKAAGGVTVYPVVVYY